MLGEITTVGTSKASVTTSVSPGLSSPSHNQDLLEYQQITRRRDYPDLKDPGRSKAPNSLDDLLQYADILYKCTLCRALPFILTSEEHFVRHMQNQHMRNGDNRNTCNHCSLKFTSEMDLHLHVNSSHPEMNQTRSQEDQTTANENFQSEEPGTKLNGIPMPNINNEPDNDSPQETLRKSHKRDLGHPKDKIHKFTEKVESSQAIIKAHLQEDRVVFDTQVPVHKQNKDSTAPQIQKVTVINTSETMSCSNNMSTNNLQETSLTHDSTRQQPDQNGRKYGTEAKHQTSDECLSRLHELTDQILATSLCRRQRPCLGQRDGTPFASPCFTREFGKYTKLVREGGNIVYFCQACNWKSPSRPEFYLHCSRQSHLSRLTNLDTQNEKQKTEDCDLGFNGPLCNAIPVQFNKSALQKDTINCPQSSVQLGIPIELFRRSTDSSLSNQTPLNLSKTWKIQENKFVCNEDKKECSHLISDTNCYFDKKENRTSPKRDKPDASIEKEKYSVQEFVYRSAVKTHNSVHGFSSSENEKVKKQNTADAQQCGIPSCEQPNRAEAITSRRRRKRPTPRMVRNQDSLCKWTDLSDSNTDSDVEPGAVKKRHLSFPLGLVITSPRTEADDSAKNSSTVTENVYSRKPLPTGADDSTKNDSQRIENVYLREPLPTGPGDSTKNDSPITGNVNSREQPRSGADASAKNDRAITENVNSREFQSRSAQDNCSNLTINSICVDTRITTARKHDNERQYDNALGKSYESNVFCKDVKPNITFSDNDCKPHGNSAPATGMFLVSKANYNFPDNIDFHVEPSIKSDYCSNRNNTFSMEFSGEQYMGRNSSLQIGDSNEGHILGDNAEPIQANNYSRVLSTNNETELDIGYSSDADGLKTCNREGWKISKIKDILSDFIIEVSHGNISRDRLLIKVSHAFSCPDAVNWGPACNRAVREEFPASIAQRKGKYKKTYFFGVQFVGDSCLLKEGTECDTFSLNPLRDMSHDTEKILQYLPDLVFWSGNLDSGVARDELLGLLEEKMSDSNVMVWGIECNRAVRRLYPRVHTRRRGKYKTTVFYGLSFRAHVQGHLKNFKCTNRTSPDILEAVPDVQGHSSHVDDMIISPFSELASELHDDNHKELQIQNRNTCN